MCNIPSSESCPPLEGVEKRRVSGRLAVPPTGAIVQFDTDPYNLGPQNPSAGGDGGRSASGFRSISATSRALSKGLCPGIRGAVWTEPGTVAAQGICRGLSKAAALCLRQLRKHGYPIRTAQSLMKKGVRGQEVPVSD